MCPCKNDLQQISPQLASASCRSTAVARAGGSPNTQFERVINTRVLILRAQGSGTYYLHVYDGWLSASTVEGPWSQITASPSGLDDVGQQLAESGQVDLLDGGNAQPAFALRWCAHDLREPRAGGTTRIKGPPDPADHRHQPALGHEYHCRRARQHGRQPHLRPALRAPV